MYIYTRTRCTLDFEVLRVKIDSVPPAVDHREGRDRHCRPVLGILKKGIGVPGSKFSDFIEVSRFLTALRHCLQKMATMTIGSSLIGEASEFVTTPLTPW